MELLFNISKGEVGEMQACCADLSVQGAYRCCSCDVCTPYVRGV